MRTVPGVASKLALRDPGPAGTAGVDSSVDSASAELLLETPGFFFLCSALWMDAPSDGRLASWWKTFLFLMMAYTRLQLPVWQSSVGVAWNLHWTSQVVVVF